MTGTLINLKLVQFLDILTLSSEEKAVQLRKAFRKLSQMQQLIIVHEYLDGLETREIARKMNLTVHEVRFKREEALSALWQEC
jgi:DNA-directed RNA polymerase specialized sigma24 family protein